MNLTKTIVPAKYVIGFTADDNIIMTSLRAELQYPESWALDQDSRLDLTSQTYVGRHRSQVDIVDRIVNAHAITTCPKARSRAQTSLVERDPWFYEPNTWTSVQKWMDGAEQKTLPEGATIAYWHYGRYHCSEVPAGASVEIIQEGRIAIRNASQ